MLMVFDTEINFYLKGNDKYNPKTGKHDADTQLVATLDGNVTDNSTIRNMEALGKYDINTKTIRLVEEVDFNWSYLVIEGSDKHYSMLHGLEPLKVNSILVGETQ